MNFFLELAERSGVGGLVLFEELKHLLNLLRAELMADGVKVLTLELPEVDFLERVGVVAILKSTLGVFLQNALNLSGPVNNGSFQKLCFVLTRSLLALSNVIRRKRKECLSINESNSHIEMGKESMELIHEILRHQIGPSSHVERVSHNRHVYVITDLMEILEHVLADFLEDDFVVDVHLVNSNLISSLYGGLGSEN